MVKPDIIVCWPRNCDYPLWRQFIRDKRPRFNEIMIAFTETYFGDDFRSFVMESMTPDYCHFIQPITSLTAVDDWRNVAVNRALMFSYNAEWLWFTEQDFSITDERFWDDVEAASNLGIEAIGIKQGDRLHPACLFMKRDALNLTSKNFGIIPGVSDHFGIIQKDIESKSISLATLNPAYYAHMNGLSHNYRLITEGQEPVYKKDQFLTYLRHCLNATVPLDKRFINTAKQALQRY